MAETGDSLLWPEVRSNGRWPAAGTDGGGPDIARHEFSKFGAGRQRWRAASAAVSRHFHTHSLVIGLCSDDQRPKSRDMTLIWAIVSILGECVLRSMW